METPQTETSAIALMGDTKDSPGTDANATNADYWNCLISESAAAAYLSLVAGTLANKRQDGTGPRFIHISARCIKYRRCDLRDWCDAKLRSSTSDPGPDQAAAA